EVFVFKVALKGVNPPLKVKFERLVELAANGLSKVTVTSASVADPTAVRTLGGVREPESGKALISASASALLVLNTKRSINMPASRVPILKIRGMPASTCAWVTV